MAIWKDQSTAPAAAPERITPAAAPAAPAASAPTPAADHAPAAAAPRAAAVRAVERESVIAPELTIEGKQWIANLYSHVFTIEHQRKRLGPQAGAKAGGGERA